MEELIDYSMEPGLEVNIKYTKKTNPIISIVTAYYNASKYIVQTAYSIINQTFENWEWIIVNDGSTEENTNDVLEGLLKLDDRIKIYNKDNQGPAIARDYGIEKARSEYICIIDSDDLFEKTFLECAYWSLITNPKASWAYSNIIAFGEDNYVWKPKFDVKREKSENIIPAAGLIRKEAFTEVGGYSSYITEYHEDWKIWLLFLRKNLFPIRMNYYGIWYRRRSSGRLKTILKQPEKRQKVLERLFNISKDISDNIEGINYPDCYKNSSDIVDINTDLLYNDNETNNSNDSILFFIPKLDQSEFNDKYLECIEKLHNESKKIYIITDKECEYELRHKFEKYAIVYDLTSFISINYWQNFIDYIIEKNQISKIISVGINFFDFIMDKQKYKNIVMLKIYYNKIKSLFDLYDYIEAFDRVDDIYKLIKSTKKEKAKDIVEYQKQGNYLYLDFLQYEKDVEDKNKEIKLTLDELKKHNDEMIMQKDLEYKKAISILEEDKNSIIEQKNRELVDKNAELAEKNTELEKQNNIIREKENELNKIYSGKTWKIASKMSNFIKKIRKV